MAKVTKIHQNKQPVRRHFLGEWLEFKGIEPMELVALLNDPERSMEFSEIDKSQVYRWIDGQMPQPRSQLRIAAALGFEEDPGKLMRDPYLDWMSDFFRGRDADELRRIRTTLETAFPRKKAG